MTKMYFFLIIIFVITSCTLSAQLPFKYDNTSYKTVYLNEAFHLMETTPSYLLLDVRTPGEYADTSSHTALNIGRFKGAVNISIDSISAHMDDLQAYTDKPIFIYCSHSQRSRRVGKLLSEKGFQKVYNINGGMSIVNESDEKTFPYKSKVLVTNIAYKNIASADAIELLKHTPGLAVIDIRTEVEFSNKDTNPSNNIGHIKNAINIPQNKFAATFDNYKIDKSRPVLLYDLDGHNSMDVTDVLLAKGFTRIYNLYEGLSTLIADHNLTDDLRKQLFADAPAYRLLDPKSTIDLLSNHPNTIVIDVRPADEFDNKSDMYYLNVGRIKNAVHVASVESLKKTTASVNKSTPVLIYGSGKSIDDAVCDALLQEGFKQVNKLSGSLYHLAWSTANVESCKDGKKFLTNHEGLY